MAQGKRWRTAEHFYQAMKSDDPDTQERIRNAPTPTGARRMGNDIPVRPDWNRVVDTPEAHRVATSIGVPSMTTGDMVMLEAITRKFMDNPQLAIQLKSTAPAVLSMSVPISTPSGVDTGRVVMYVRDQVIPTDYGQERDNIDTMFTNFYLMLQEQGYDIPDDAPRQDVQGYRVDGAIIDIYLDPPYPESRLKEVIKMNESLEDKPAYIILGYLAKGSISKILRRVAAYNNIRYYSPSEVIVTASNHRLNPRFNVISPDDPNYDTLSSLPMAELDSSDALAKQLGLRLGQILEVHDFSLHYRKVV